MRRDPLWILFIQLVAVWAYAVSQPTFSLLEANPEFLVVRGSTRVEVIVFATLLVFGLPLAAIASEWLVAKASTRAADVLHLAFLLVFLLPWALRLVKLLGLSGPDLVLLATVSVSVTLVAAYARWRAVRLFLAVSAVLPIVGLLSFVLRIPLATDDADAARVEIASPVPVTVLILDEFPVSSLMTHRGEIDAVRYPNFARLARDATWYRNATTVHEHTTGAVPAILTGRMPGAGELPVLADHPQNLFTLLGATYSFHVHEEITHLCPRNLCRRNEGSFPDRLDSLFEDVGVAYLHRVLPRSMSGRLPSIDDRWGRFVQEGKLLGAQSRADIEDVFERFIWPKGDEVDELVSALSRDEAPAALHLAHLLLPHSPWKYLPSGRQYGVAGWRDGFDWETDRWGTDAWLVEQGLQGHLLQVQYTDAVLGRLLDQLERTELYDRSLLVVVADHGVSIRPGGHRRIADRRTLGDIAGVPLFVKYPHQRGLVDDRAARTIDILPTISDVLGIRLPWSVDGRSLRRPAPPRSRVVVLRRDGTRVGASLAELVHARAATVRRNIELFGEKANSLYRIGTNLRLLGSEVASSTLSKAVRIRIEGDELLRDVRLSSGFVPARIHCIVEQGSIDSQTELAVAVNGRIEALTRASAAGGHQFFGALVPERAFREGSNRVDVYAIEREGREVRFVRLGGTPTR